MVERLELGCEEDIVEQRRRMRCECTWFKMAGDALRRVRKYVVLRKYNDFTIEDYFRKQGARVGKRNRILIRDLGESPYLISIGNHCTIANGVNLLTHDGGGWVFTDESPSVQRYGVIEILDNCFIGFRSTVMPNVRIGPNAIVGACAVVTKDVHPETVVAGNPARKISTIHEYRAKILKLWSQQRPKGYLADLKDGIVHPPDLIEHAKRRDMYMIREHLMRILVNRQGASGDSTDFSARK